MQRWMLIATLPLSLLFAGCDAEPEEPAQDSIEVAPEQDAPSQSAATSAPATA